MGKLKSDLTHVNDSAMLCVYLIISNRVFHFKFFFQLGFCCITLEPMAQKGFPTWDCHLIYTSVHLKRVHIMFFFSG